MADNKSPKKNGEKRRKNLGFVKADPDAAGSADQGIAAFSYAPAADGAIDAPSGDVSDDCHTQCHAGDHAQKYFRVPAHNLIIAV